MRPPMKYLFISFFFLIGQLANAQTNVTGSLVSKQEADDALAFHNKVRKDVGAPPLQWSGKLAAFAQKWADHLAAEGNKIKHRPGTGEWAQQYGENIFWGQGEGFSPLEASKDWYSEIKDYTYTSLSDNNWFKTGHYTQMVWRNTTRVGIGMAKSKDGTIIIVANYDPRGNYLGEKPY